MSHSRYQEQSRCALERESETKRQLAQRRQRAMQSVRLWMPSASAFHAPLAPEEQLPSYSSSRSTLLLLLLLVVVWSTTTTTNTSGSSVKW